MSSPKLTLEALMLRAFESIPFTERERRCVATILLTSTGRPTTQNQIANNHEWAELNQQIAERGTGGKWFVPTFLKNAACRRIRRTIRELRVENGFPIMSDEHGYRLPQDWKAVNKFMDRMGKTARARAKASMVTYHKLLDTFRLPAEPLLPEIDAELVRLRAENRALKADLARWGRPSARRKAERATTGGLFA